MSAVSHLEFLHFVSHFKMHFCTSWKFLFLFLTPAATRVVWKSNFISSGWWTSHSLPPRWPQYLLMWWWVLFAPDEWWLKLSIASGPRWSSAWILDKNMSEIQSVIYLNQWKLTKILLWAQNQWTQRTKTWAVGMTSGSLCTPTEHWTFHISTAR